MTINRNPKRAGRGGFTLVEMLLVLAILAILAGIVYPNLTHRIEQARVTAATTQIGTLKTALRNFEIDNGYFPGGKDGLQALVIKPHDASHWRGPYLENEVPKDPWGKPYIYECPGKRGLVGYDLYSKGGLDGVEIGIK